MQTYKIIFIFCLLITLTSCIKLPSSYEIVTSNNQTIICKYMTYDYGKYNGNECVDGYKHTDVLKFKEVWN